jgi:glycogen synthase
MRILIVSNFYPPSRSWGYTQLCHEASEQLAARGHIVSVLTSNYQVAGEPVDTIPVYRSLHLESDPLNYEPVSFFTSRRKRVKENSRTLKQTVSAFQPDVIFIWGMWNMSRYVAAAAERLEGVKVVYYVSDHWPVHERAHDVYWRLPARRWYMKPVKATANRLALGLMALDGNPPALRFENAICVSHTLRDSLVAKGAPLHKARVIHNGIDTTAFSADQRRLNGQGKGEGLQLLYAGRMSYDKGVHTAILALARLLKTEDASKVHLSIAGNGAPDYTLHLQRLVEEHGLGEHVTFHGLVSREAMPALLNRCDVLIFPSIALEALPRMPQEAMACGLVVVGTTTGGTRELLLDGETGLTFPPEDDQVLAAQLLRLAQDPALRERLACNGRRLVLEKFTLGRMVDEIEAYLNT